MAWSYSIVKMVIGWIASVEIERVDDVALSDAMEHTVVTSGTVEP